MSYEETLHKVEEDVQRGDLGKARDRLHGLIRSYPDALILRKRLGDLYARLQFPQMAGRYYYLESEPSEEEKVAIAAFEKSVKGDSRQILQALKFRGDIKMLPSRAKERLTELQKECGYEYPQYGRKDKPVWVQHGSMKNRIMPVACVVLAAVVVLLVIIGLASVIGWFAR